MFSAQNSSPDHQIESDMLIFMGREPELQGVSCVHLSRVVAKMCLLKGACVHSCVRVSAAYYCTRTRSPHTTEAFLGLTPSFHLSSVLQATGNLPAVRQFYL